MYIYIYTLGSPIGQDFKSPKDLISGIQSGRIFTCEVESIRPILPASTAVDGGNKRSCIL